MTDLPTDPSSSYARVQDILLLPPLPVVACKLLALVSQEDCEVSALATLIEQDPGLAARIVGIANSAYFARRAQIASVSEAIARVLGLNLVRGIAIGIALSKPFDASACPAFELERYWYRAFQTANLAAALAPLTQLSDAERHCLFLCGLLHNLGQIVLVHAFPDRMNKIFQLWDEQPTPGLRSYQTKYIAMTEIEAGTLIAKRWQLPTSVAEVIEFRHEPLHAGASAPLVQLIAGCSNLASAMYDDVETVLPPPKSFGTALANAQPEAVEKVLQQLLKQHAPTLALAHSLTSSV